MEPLIILVYNPLTQLKNRFNLVSMHCKIRFPNREYLNHSTDTKCTKEDRNKNNKINTKEMQWQNR